MHYTKAYTTGERETRDARAIADIQDYLTPKQWNTFLQIAGDPASTADMINAAFGFVGISGYPFHAFCRHYMLTRYRDWMHAGDDAVQTDDDGFPI